MPKLPSRRAVITYMKSQMSECQDPDTDAVNLTELAELAGEHFALFDEHTNKLPDVLDDWAFEAVYGSGN